LLERDQVRTIEPDSVARNAFAALATQLTSALFTAAVTLYLVRALGPPDYGLFALAVGIGALVSIASDAGITQSAERFIAERGGERSSVAPVLADALALKLVASGAACAALIAAAGPIADAYGEPDLAWPLRAIAVAVLGQSALFLYRGAFVALGRASLAWRVLTIESAVEAGAIVALVLAGAGAAGAAWGRASGYVVGALVGALLAARLVGWTRRGGGGSMRRRIGAYAGALFVVNAAFTLFEQIDVLLIGAILSKTAVGVFEAPFRLTVFLSYAGQALAFGIAPRLARAADAGRSQAFAGAVRLLVIVQAALLAPALVWAEPITGVLLGSGYEESAGVLRTLAPFLFLSAIGTFVTLSVNYLGEGRRRIPIAIAAVVVNIALDAVLIPEIGVLGGAVGTDVAFALYLAGHLWISRDLVDLRPLPLAITLARALVAAGAAAGALAAFGTDSLSALDAVAGAVAALAAYAFVLGATREVSPGDVRAAVRGVEDALRRA
jgi:O-antigen/teichoic acid export membrane protein